MRGKQKERENAQMLPMLLHETLYVGVDIGKGTHVAGFISSTLLSRHQRFESCPAFSFENSREGFRTLVDRTNAYVPLTQVYVVLEATGHYHRALLQYLQELDVPIYVMHIQERPHGMLKTDKRDALGLGNHLYNQLDRGIQVGDPLQAVRRLVPPSAAAAQLRSMVRHRYELIGESTRRKNKLTAICDEVFPEFTQVLHNPNLPTALAIRKCFPTPLALATAPLSALQEARGGTRYLSDAKLLELQRLGTWNIGTKDPARLHGLTVEQEQLIEELELLQRHLEKLEAEMMQVVMTCRDGKILTSIPSIGPISAAIIIAMIGAIANFERPTQLKSYFGWAPTLQQSGKALDHAKLSPRGTRLMKQTMYLIVWQAIRIKGCEWSKIYEHLVPLKCRFDERTRRYTGRGKAIGRIAGQIISVIFALLKTDQEMLSKWSSSTEPPPPLLYDPQIHQQHRSGQYQPHSVAQKPRQLIQFPLP